MIDIINGTVEDSFAPFSDPTALILYDDGPGDSYDYGCIIIMGSKSASSTSSTGFTDVPSSAAYAQAVAWAVEKGITAGKSDTTFAPDATCTRGEIVTFLHRAMG